MVTLLVILKNLKDLGFTVLIIVRELWKPARFIENDEISGSDNLRNVYIQEGRVQVPMPVTSNKIVVPIVFEQPNNIE